MAAVRGRDLGLPGCTGGGERRDFLPLLGKLADWGAEVSVEGGSGRGWG
jgi:hypothetical protein